MSLRHCIATLFFAVPALGLVACANRGMEAPGAGGAAVGTGGAAGQTSGTGGAASGGSGGRGTGGVAGKPGTGRTSGSPGTGGATGGASGGSGGGAGRNSSGGAPGTGGAAGAPATGGAGGGSGGVAGAGGRAATGGAGGVAGNGGAGGGSNQIIVSIDFVGGSGPTGGASGGTLVGAPAMTATETAGVKPAANWNGAASIMGTLGNLLRSDGTATAASVTWNSPSTAGNPGEWMNGYADAPGNTRMMNGYLDPTASTSPATVKVSGLPTSIAGGYDVYVYAFGDLTSASTRTYQYAIGGTTVTVSQTGPSPSTFPGFTLAPAGGSGSY
ncbi:MAG TPA: hypothetical protein VLT58_15180, partial [Polyangia bacterium]|nr:hypothetical protein [Polyangia bacterium]